MNLHLISFEKLKTIIKIISGVWFVFWVLVIIYAVYYGIGEGKELLFGRLLGLVFLLVVLPLIIAVLVLKKLKIRDTKEKLNELEEFIFEDIDHKEEHDKPYVEKFYEAERLIEEEKYDSARTAIQESKELKEKEEKVKNKIMEVYGWNGKVILYEDRVELIRKGLQGWIEKKIEIGSNKKDKEIIKLEDINKIRLKKPGILVGYIQFRKWKDEYYTNKTRDAVANNETITISHLPLITTFKFKGKFKNYSEFKELKKAVEKQIKKINDETESTINEEDNG